MPLFAGRRLYRVVQGAVDQLLKDVMTFSGNHRQTDRQTGLQKVSGRGAEGGDRLLTADLSPPYVLSLSLCVQFNNSMCSALCI